jgi:arylformamidase
MQVIPEGAEVFDVTVPLSPDLPVWPGDPDVSVEPLAQIGEGDTANVSRLTLSSHSGTHVDAPRHFFANGMTLDAVAVDRWLGPCFVLAVPDDAQRIGPEHLEGRVPPGTERLLLKTANSKLWRPGKASFTTDYVALSAEGAQWLIEREIKLVGIDYLSIEPFTDAEHETHRALLGNDILIIEALNLTRIEPGEYGLMCLPLPLAGGDGAPARVLLIRDGKHDPMGVGQ